MLVGQIMINFQMKTRNYRTDIFSNLCLIYIIAYHFTPFKNSCSGAACLDFSSKFYPNINHIPSWQLPQSWLICHAHLFLHQCSFQCFLMLYSLYYHCNFFIRLQLMFYGCFQLPCLFMAMQWRSISSISPSRGRPICFYGPFSGPTLNHMILMSDPSYSNWFINYIGSFPVHNSQATIFVSFFDFGPGFCPHFCCLARSESGNLVKTSPRPDYYFLKFFIFCIA